MKKTHRTILLIDDSPADRVAICRALAGDPDYDYTVREAAMGDEGLRLWRAERPDCVLLDYQLPATDGLTLLGTITAERQPRPCPVVLLTGLAATELAVAALKDGAQDFIIKDRTTPEQLRHTVTNAIEKVAAQRQIATQQQQLVESEARFSAAFHNNPAPMSIVSEVEAKYLDVNQACTELFGLTRAAMLGRSPAEVGVYADPAQGPLLRDVLNDGYVRDFEVKWLAKGGAVRTHLLNADRITLDGQPCLFFVSNDITERGQHERWVQDTFDYAENLIATLREPFLVLSKDLRVKTANRSFYEIFHVSPEETENQFIYDLGNRQWDIPALRTLLEEVLSDRHPVHDYEVEHDFQTIGQKVMLLNARRVSEPGKVSELILLAIEDITERKQQERLVQDTFDYVENLIATLREPFIVLSKDLRVKTANRSFYEIFHVSPEETENQFIYDLGNRQWDIPALRTLLEEVLSDRHPVHDYEVEHDFQTIGQKIMLLNARRVSEPGKVSELILLAIEDITQRKQHERWVQDTFDYVENLIATLREPFLVLSKDLRVKTANRSFYEIFHVSPEETENQFIYDLGNRQWDIPALRTLLEEVLSDRHPVHDYEVEHDFQTIGQKVMLLNARRVSEPGKVSELILLAIEDTTERKLVENKRERILEQEQQTRALAEEANRAKDEFLAVVSHELRSPLNAMLGYARLLSVRCAQLAPDIGEFAEIIKRNGERQNELINDLLDTARITTGKLRLEIAPLNFTGIIHDALAAGRSSAQAKNLTLQTTLDDGFIPSESAITGDAARLQQVVWNLLTNAVKFTPIGGSIKLSLQAEPGHVVLTVSDNGQGITPDFLPHVFERFSQQDGSNSRRYGGLGLGLALVKQIVELHGGTIEAVSAGTGCGATFTVRLPIRAAAQAAPESLPAAPPDADFTPATLVLPLCLQGVTTLIVDDDADALKLLMLLLEAQGATVTKAATAAAAWPALISALERPHILISDISMPEEDGYSLLRRLRLWEREHSRATLPAIALTAHNRPQDRLQALRAGFQMHVPKPVELDELLIVVNSLLERAKLAFSAGVS